VPCLFVHQQPHVVHAERELDVLAGELGREPAGLDEPITGCGHSLTARCEDGWSYDWFTDARQLANRLQRRDAVESDNGINWREVVSRPLRGDTSWPLSSEVRLEVAGASARGKVQPYNTDHYLAIRLGRLQETLISSLSDADLPPRFEEYGYAMLVADGLGSGAEGARASRVALSALAHLAIRYGKWNVRVTQENTVDIVEQGDFFCRRANDAVTEAKRAHSRLADIATSLTTVYIAGDDLFFAHVGHSRAFLFRAGALTQLTVDDTLEELRLRAPGPTSLDQAKRDLTHVVTQTIGGAAEGPYAAIEHFHLFPGDRVLLCTNGLTDAVSSEEIADVLTLQRHPDDDCRRLIDLALEKGGPDNVTVIVANYWLPTFTVESDAIADSANIQPGADSPARL